MRVLQIQYLIFLKMNTKDIETTVLESVRAVQLQRFQVISKGIINYALEKKNRAESEAFNFASLQSDLWNLTADEESTQKERLRKVFNDIKPNYNEFEMVVDVLVKKDYLDRKGEGYLATRKL